MLQLLEADALRFRVEEEDNQELDCRHNGKENEGVTVRRRRERGKCERNDGVHDPVRRAAQALALGAHAIRENFADVYPDHCALRNGEESDVRDEEPEQIALMLVRKKNT